MHVGDERKGERQRARGTLAAYLSALAVVFIVVAGAGAWYVSHRASGDGRRSAAQDARFSARTTAKQLADGVAALRAQVSGLAQTPGLEQAFATPEKCQLSFGGPSGLDAGHIDIIASDGSVACTSVPNGRSARPVFASAPWFAAARRGAIFVAPAADPSSGDHAIVAAAPIRGGMVAGFLALESAGPSLRALFGGRRPAELLVAGGDPRQVITRSIAPASSVAQPLPSDRLPVAGTARDLNGRARIYASAPIAGTNWRVYVGEDDAAAVAGAHALRNRQLLIIGIGSCVMLLGTWLVYRRLALPVGRLADEVRKSAAVTPPTPVPVPSGPREISALGDDVNGLITTVGDELDRRRDAEEHAARAALRYELLFARSPLPTWVEDRATGEIVHVNEAALATYGYERDAFLALHGADLVEDEHHHRTSDGTRIEVRVLEHDVIEGDRPVRIVVAEDISERQQLERRIRQQQRMEAIGRLAGGIAHDFNNLLAAIMGSSELLVDRATDRERRSEAEQIKLAAERASELTHQLLAFARGREEEQVVLELGELIEKLRPMLERLLPDGVALDLRRGPSPVYVRANASQLEQVTVNLVVNAGHAMPDGGTASISTMHVEGAEPPPHADADGGPYATLTVTDTGVGMDADTLSKVFEPFFTTRPDGGGTGLGLATVYGIVQSGGGWIDVASTPNRGTTFTIFLPAATHSAPAGATTDGHGTADVIEGRGGHVLLVEDDPAIRRIVSRYLTARDFQPLAAPDGDAAMALSEAEPAGSLDLVITDNVVPGPGGLELAARIRERHPGARVLVMSGYDSEDVLGDQPLAPRTAFVTKPFTQDTLTTVLLGLLAAD